LLVNANHSQYQSHPGGGSVPVVPRPDSPVLDLDREPDRGRVGRRIERAAVADIELRAVEDAFDGRFLAVETTGREFEVLVAAAVLEGVIVAVVVDDDDGGVAVPGDGLFTGQQFGSRADPDPG